MSMVFGNNHFTINHPRPALPDIIEVGGMHTRPPKPLPKVLHFINLKKVNVGSSMDLHSLINFVLQDLDDFLTGSGKDGFIFFSLGSIVKAKV